MSLRGEVLELAGEEDGVLDRGCRAVVLDYLHKREKERESNFAAVYLNSSDWWSQVCGVANQNHPLLFGRQQQSAERGVVVPMHAQSLCRLFFLCLGKQHTQMFVEYIWKEERSWEYIYREREVQEFQELGTSTCWSPL